MDNMDSEQGTGESALLDALMAYEGYMRSGEMTLTDYVTLATGSDVEAEALASTIQFGAELEMRGFKLCRSHLNRPPANALEYERDGGLLYYVAKVH